MASGIDYKNIRDRISQGEIFPQLVALAYVVDWYDSQKSVSGDKLSVNYQPLTHANHDKYTGRERRKAVAEM